MRSSEAIFQAFGQLNVLIIGDVMIDRYLSGSVERISPEAPVPVVHLQQQENRLGGAANVALNLRALGANAYLCGVIGDDADGDIFQALMPEAGLSVKGILRSSERPTTVKSRILAGSQQLLRVDHEMTADLSAQESVQYLQIVRNLLDERTIHVILLQDYNKGVLSLEIIRAIMLEALRRDIPTAVDPKFHNFWAYKRVTLFKPNLKEIRSQLPTPVLPERTSLCQAAEAIRKKIGNEYTLITLSDKGLFIEKNGDDWLESTRPRQIADVSGAGDTVISVAALGLAIGLSLREMAALANLAGGQVCERLGVVPVNKTQLQQEYDDYRQMA
ncbi:MAG TPA: PfkB family carbohydrate kinase [Saprospiraceae bacterium]|nr:PfkB family carbohydrate kinase [Saprospiraceae bacterium]HMP14618.1 PfkB family carbohydrate kinase [Saprospiraceae bacterium]